ncbi:sensor histidine kinase [Lentibacillus sp. JNUCC-1]|uniref:sensor histidine kinase n=1 Tax=Lentibacillus sp. JNUCC-1 TaxID=2654513 RepID=UPI001E53C3D0|nr:HAMP domain-containing sensor histidine kinase [Lentibacillus sp. JNUCC-1]
MKGYLQLIDKSNGSEQQTKYLKTISAQVNKIEHITAEFAALAEPHLGAQKEVNVTQLFENVKNHMEPQALAKSITISVETEHDTCTIICDEVKMKQVFINLVKNAIEAMDQGHITLEAKEAAPHYFNLSVSDNGPGIPDHIFNQLGQPFLTTKPNGAGLGLLICKKIAEAHGGQLMVDSEVGKGTKVTVSLLKSETVERG